MENTNEIPGAFGFTDFDEISESDRDFYLQSRIINRENKESEIDCISVNSNHEVAVAVKNYINVYNADGKYLYGYYIPTSKSKLISLHCENIEVYVDVFDVYFTIDRQGQVENLKYVSNSLNNRKIMGDLLVYANESQWTIDGLTFYSNCKELSKSDNLGNSVIIYKMSQSAQTASKENKYPILAVVIILLIMTCTNILKKHKQ